MDRQEYRIPDLIEELTPSEWKSLGFGGGLEIHQQLDTKRKLFCRCPVGYSHMEPDARILRHMRPTLSEMGEYDGTALMEFKTKKNVVYELFSDSTCSYEMDDTPPFPLNQEALDIAIEISLLLNCSIVDEVHVTRKQYLDGSIPTGFQRTLIVGVGGWIPFNGRRLNITQVNLEEDACREMSDIGHNIIFRTDRLSTPLVEVITEKELLTPREMMEANRELGRVLRCSKVRRGIGSVRQDVNVSIAGGDRNEIKGVQRYQRVLALTHFEALRQKALLELRETLHERGITEKKIKTDEKIFRPGCRDLKSPFLTTLFKAGHALGVVKLSGFAGLPGKELQPHRTFADEIADRIRVIACLDGKPNLFHSDDREHGALSAADWEVLFSQFKAGHNDVLLATFGPEGDVATAISEIKIRAREATLGVPRETRQDLGGGITGFERILPGPDRMYPDTDSEPVKITPERVERIRLHLSLRPWEKEERCRKLGVSERLARQLADSDRYAQFERLASREPDLARNLAQLICVQFPHLKKEGEDPTRLTDPTLLSLSRLLFEKRIGQENLPELLVELCASTAETQERKLRSAGGNGTALDAPAIRKSVAETAASFRGEPGKLFHVAMGSLRRSHRDLPVSDALLKTVRDELNSLQRN